MQIVLALLHRQCYNCDIGQHNGAHKMKNANGLTVEQQARADAWQAKANAAYVKKYGMTLDQAEAMARVFND